MFRLFVTLWCCCCCLGSPALQTQTQANETELQEAVNKTIIELLAKPSFKNKLQKKFPGLKGQLTVDLGINYKGKVVSFYVVAQDLGQAPALDFLASQMLACQFPFRLEKHKQIKIRQTIRIEN